MQPRTNLFWHFCFDDVPDAAVANPSVVAEVLQRLHTLAAELDEHGGEVEGGLDEGDLLSPVATF